MAQAFLGGTVQSEPNDDADQQTLSLEILTASR